MHVPWTYLSIFFFRAEFLDKCLLSHQFESNGFLLSVIRNVRLGFSGRRKQGCGHTHQRYLWGRTFKWEMETSLPFASVESMLSKVNLLLLKGTFAIVQMVSSKRRRLKDSALGSSGRNDYRKEISTMWKQCLVEDIKVESCLNSAEGEPGVTLLSIVSFFVNEIRHGQWHRL